jgi:D-threo-aldose 1-dehydrogenase
MRRLTVPWSANGPSVLGFGCAWLAGGFEAPSNLRLVRAAFEAGIRHFDVAPLYGLGTAEDVLGRALRGRRHQVTLATKVGIERPAANALRSLVRAATGPLRRAIRRVRPREIADSAAESRPVTDFSAAAVSASLDESLVRLRTDYVDLLLLHEVQLADVSDELLTMLEQRRRAGAFRALGLATEPADIDAIARARPGVFEVFQCRWSVLDWRQPMPTGAPLLVTHRALLRAFAPLRRWLAADAAARVRLESATGEALTEDGSLSRLLIAAALAANTQGVVLVASRRKARVLDNARVADDSRLLAAGARFAAALTLEPQCPMPS